LVLLSIQNLRISTLNVKTVDKSLSSTITTLFCLINLTGMLNGKNVVITGGSAGIGQQLAYHYARMGARVLITSRTEADLKKVTLFFV